MSDGARDMRMVSATAPRSADYSVEQVMPPHSGSSPDAFSGVCPSRLALARLGQKWTVLAMIALREKHLRFAEIRRRLDGVSDKMLSQTLRSMERDGLVERCVDDRHPARIEYGLTVLARTVLPIVTELKQWAERSIDSIEASNHAYDHKIERSTCQAVS
ncbi:winged helix-turn-helix transcriptional regulator [Paraburkholderia phytofirmans]|uniref:winged helix-turn-helix transcriptional regulator n=1 Tax=Paraburkholderia phytofirmans TaxID=261302 RepID=UPI0038B92927